MQGCSHQGTCFQWTNMQGSNQLCLQSSRRATREWPVWLPRNFCTKATSMTWIVVIQNIGVVRAWVSSRQSTIRTPGVSTILRAIKDWNMVHLTDSLLVPDQTESILKLWTKVDLLLTSSVAGSASQSCTVKSRIILKLQMTKLTWQEIMNHIRPTTKSA